MTSEQRAALIRERFLARWPSSRPVTASAKAVRPEPDRVPYRNFSLGLLEREHWRKDWITAPDAKAKTEPRPERRRKGQNALARIAAHYPVRHPQSVAAG